MAATLSRTFESLRVRNYRMFFAGQVVSWTGTWVQWVAQGWLVLRLTQSGLGLGIVTAIQWLPILLLGAWAGVVADRLDKRRLLIFTNASAALLSLVLGLLTVAGVVTLWMVIVDALLLGVVTALDNPARQTFTMEMVGRERIANAVSLNTATFTTARVVGPAVAGVMISTVGIGVCFLINAASFVPVTLALMFMNRSELRPSEQVERGKGQVREGLRYVRSVPVLKTLLTMMAVIGTLQYNFAVLLPVLAKETFSGDAGTLGLIGAAVGVGMFAGSIGNAAIGRSDRKVLLGAGFALGAFTIAAAGAPPLWLAVVLLVPLGAASMAFLATMNSTLQLTAADDMRGRVMAIYFVLFLGSTPIGAPIVGWLSEQFSPRVALAFGGVATILACVYGLAKLPQLGGERVKTEDDSELAVAGTSTAGGGA
ncbi:MAG TPA: MFS transporter [Actinomycetota bacterium]|nr:MFS transporter [Actinomycetota bacterium]